MNLVPLPSIHEVEPREQVGARTGDLYEYQYHQAASEAFRLLDDQDTTCLYCEWHDDFVLEDANTGVYRFCQVKTRKAAKGPWKVKDFFGNKNPKKKQPIAAETDTPFAKLREHLQTFGGRCDRLLFITDNAIDRVFEDLLSAAKAHSSSAAFPAAMGVEYTTLLGSLVAAFPDLDDDGLHTFLRKLDVLTGVGSVGKLEECLIVIATRILSLSEVDLLVSQAKKMGADLVTLVRKRSDVVYDKKLPLDAYTLKKDKGIVLDDVLRVLSLSPEGYRQLKSGGRQSVLELSRLHRLCKRCEADPAIIPDLCGLKATWDAWWLKERHNIDPLDFVTFKDECATTLRAHSDGGLDFKSLVGQAKALTAKYGAKLLSSTPITAELILGFMLSLAAQAEV